MNTLLSEIYSNHKSAAGLSGEVALLREARKSNKSVSIQDVRKFLHSNETYTRFYPIRRKIKTNKFLGYLNSDHYADLAFFNNLKKYNRSYAYLLVVVDAFSRFLMVRPLKTKEAREVYNAYLDILLKTKRIPFRLKSDAGTEFTAGVMKKLYSQFGINHSIAKNTDIKAGFAENAIFRIKNKLQKYFHLEKTLNWIDAIDGIVDGLNSTYINSIGTSPALVTYQTAQEVWKRVYKSYIESGSCSPKFLVGSVVRVSHSRQVFRKGTDSRYSSELFRIKKIVNYPNPVYILEDLNGEEIDAFWYAEELIEFTKDSDIYSLEKIIRKRKRNGKQEFLVKFKGYKELYWIPARDLQNE